MQIKSGIVKYPAAKEFPDLYKPGQTKQNVVIHMNTGQDEKIWFSTGRQPHVSLKKGDRVQIIFEQREGKLTRRLIVDNTNNNGSSQNSTSSANSNPRSLSNNTSNSTSQISGSKELTAEEKRAIANYIQNQSDLLGYCLDVSIAKYSDKVQSEESLRTLATTLFITTQRKFNL